MTQGDEFREAAAQCLELAQSTSDESTRAGLLTMAQKFHEAAGRPANDPAFDRLVDEFNNAQMFKDIRRHQ